MSKKSLQDQLDAMAKRLAALESRILCERCGGKGHVEVPHSAGWAHGMSCPTCHGTGNRVTPRLEGPAIAQGLGAATSTQ